MGKVAYKFLVLIDRSILCGKHRRLPFRRFERFSTEFFLALMSIYSVFAITDYVTKEEWDKLIFWGGVLLMLIWVLMGPVIKYFESQTALGRRRAMKNKLGRFESV